MVACVAMRVVEAITPPPGWTSLVSDNQSITKGEIFYKLAGASEPSSYTWSWTTAATNSAAIHTYRDINPVPTIYDTAKGSNAQTDPIQAPSVTTTVADSWLYCAFYSQGNATWGVPSGMTQRTVNTGNPARQTADETIASPGATGTRQPTTNSTTHWVAFSVVVEPPAAGSALLPILQQHAATGMV